MKYLFSPPPRQQRGFSLIELLITLSVSSVLASAGHQIFEYTAKAQAMAAAHTLSRHMQLARETAIYTNREITLCGTVDGETCTKTWEEGNELMVFFDRNGDRVKDPKDDILRLHTLPAGKVSWRASGGRRYLRYRADGSVKEFGALTWCPQSGESTYARMITISRIGRTYLSRDRDGDGLHNSNRAPYRNIECPT